VATDPAAPPAPNKPVATDPAAPPAPDKPVATDPAAPPALDKPVAINEPAAPPAPNAPGTEPAAPPAPDKPVAGTEPAAPPAPDKPVAVTDPAAPPAPDKPVAINEPAAPPDNVAKPENGKPPKPTENIVLYAEEELSQFSSDKMGKMSPREMTKLPSGKVKLMPPQAFGGVKKGQLESMHGDAIGNMTQEQLTEIPDVTIEEMDEQERAKVLGNIDPITMREQAQRFLPKNWKLKDDNRIERPEGAPIEAPAKPQQLAENIEMPELPDLSKGTGLGGALGENGKSLNQCVNDLLGEMGFEANQREDGVMDIQGPQGLKMAFSPDRKGMKQGPRGSKPGISANKQGQFVLTLEDGVQMPVRPAPKDPAGAAKALQGGGKLKMGDEGEVEIAMNQAPEGVPARVGCKFDPQVMPAPQGKGPGVHKDDQGKLMMVYEDGTAQLMRPAMRNPSTFSKVGTKIPGVESITHNDDGTITVVFSGMNVMLQPDYEIKASDESMPGTPLAQEEDGSSIIQNTDGSFDFVDADGQAQAFGIGDIQPITVEETTTTDSSGMDNTPTESNTDTSSSDDAPTESNTDTNSSDDAPTESSTDISGSDDAPTESSTDISGSDDAPTESRTETSTAQ